MRNPRELGPTLTKPNPFDVPYDLGRITLVLFQSDLMLPASKELVENQQLELTAFQLIPISNMFPDLSPEHPV